MMAAAKAQYSGPTPMPSGMMGIGQQQGMPPTGMQPYNPQMSMDMPQSGMQPAGINPYQRQMQQAQEMQRAEEMARQAQQQPMGQLGQQPYGMSSQMGLQGQMAQPPAFMQNYMQQQQQQQPPSMTSMAMPQQNQSMGGAFTPQNMATIGGSNQQPPSNPFARPMQQGLGPTQSPLSQLGSGGPGMAPPSLGPTQSPPSQQSMQQNSPMQKASGSSGRTGLF
jgi:hypothetical protein